MDEGDTTALKILVDRIWPAPKGRLVPFELARAGSALEAALQLEEVTALAEDGELPVEVVRIVAFKAKIWAEGVELEELRARVEELSRLTSGRGPLRSVG